MLDDLINWIPKRGAVAGTANPDKRLIGTGNRLLSGGIHSLSRHQASEECIHEKNYVDITKRFSGNLRKLRQDIPDTMKAFSEILIDTTCRRAFISSAAASSFAMASLESEPSSAADWTKMPRLIERLSKKDVTWIAAARAL